MMFGLIILVIVAFYYFNSNNHERHFRCLNHQMPAQTPLDILNERFARGEIDREDYLERKQVL